MFFRIMDKEKSVLLEELSAQVSHEEHFLSSSLRGTRR
jgi:hypothetical protein